VSTRAARPPRPPVRILLVDDSLWQREGWSLLLGSQPDFDVVGEAGDGNEALRFVREHPVDVVLMDIQMPRLNGFAATEHLVADAQVRALGPVPRVILVTGVDLDDHVPEAARVGAYAVLYKDAEPEALFEALRAAALARDEF
jgi:DNA-binding NarL/FixJ family response regulator